MAVDQPGQHGGVAQVDHARIARSMAGDRLRGADLLDAIALDQDRLVREHRARAYGDEPPRAHQHARAGGRVRLRSETASPEEADEEHHPGAPDHRAPPIVFSTRCANTWAPAGAMSLASPLIS